MASPSAESRVPGGTVMRRAPLLALLLLAAVSIVPVTAHSAPGVNLRWDHCAGDGGTPNKDFACDVNTGLDRMVGSFVLDTGFTGLTGLYAHLHIASVNTSLPAWWAFNGPGVFGCRGSAVSTESTPPAGSAACVDWSGGAALGNMDQLALGFPGPNDVRVRILSAVPAPANLAAGAEYFAFSLVVRHTKTTGTGACAGCLEPTVIFLSGIDLNPGGPPVGTGVERRLTTGSSEPDSRWISWQRSHPVNITEQCALLSDHGCITPLTDFDAVADAVTPTRSHTWARVKSLYR